MKKIYQCFWIVPLVLLLAGSYARAQSQAVTGTIKDKDGTALPGVSIVIKGTSLGTTTDANGNFAIKASPDNTLMISFIGYKSVEVLVGNQSVVTISLEDDIATLDEIVVVGYGEQKKALNTGANFQVKGEDLQKMSTTNALQALQGQTPGVQITSTSGQPGSGMKVIIRGTGSTNGTGPLYVVDGVLTGDISYLNNSDIESITVLKDAASAAIYGSQSANGVILVTTKSGKRGKPAQITFDAFYGVQNIARKVDLLSAREYAVIRNEAALNSGQLPVYNGEQLDTLGKGTDWMNKMFVKNAPTQNYSFGISGGTESSVYSGSLSYLSQEGIVGGESLSNYERYNFRFNSAHNLYKDALVFGQNLSFAFTKSNGIAVGNQYNNTLRSAFSTPPTLVSSPTDTVGQDNYANPYYQMVYNNQNENNNQRLLGNVYLEAKILEGLKFRSSFGIDYSASSGHSFTPIYTLSIYSFSDRTQVSQWMNKGQSLLWENYLTYSRNVFQDHHVEVMAGTSAYKSNGESISGGNVNLAFNSLQYAWLDNSTNNDDAVYMSLSGSPYDEDKRLSFFGRLNYDFKETYLLNVTFRADGSSRFAEGNRWGYFPSVSAGWVISNEAFMTDLTSSGINFLKLRASWGQVGNQNVAFFQYMAPIQFTDTNYTFGSTEGTLTPGAYPSRLANPDLKWETSEQTNIGIDARFIEGRVTASLDWYQKVNKDWIIKAPILATAGADAPYINGGDVKNSGIEVALSYSETIGQVNFTVSANGTYNKNKVGRIPNEDGILHGQSNMLYANSLEFYRSQDGFPIGYFWGLKTDGLFQTDEEVAGNTSSNGTVIQPNAQPGDVRYVDRNDDGIINDLDRTNIGNPNPDFLYGFSVTANYKNFDLSVQANGVAGNEIVQSYREQSNAFGNWSSAILERWTGEGTSNSMPRVTEDNRNWTNFSELYVHKGDFLRISNVTLGYNFKNLINMNYISQLRIYVSALNAFTFTRYNGMDPEIGYGVDDMSSGIDLGYYPRPRTILVGVNVKF